MTRYVTTIVDGKVYVDGPLERIKVGEIETIITVIGGPSWTIEYDEHDIERYPDLDTSDEGLTIDVRDTIEAMTFGENFVKTLKAQPTSVETTDGTVSPRLGLFIGRLLENLEYGVR